MVLRGSSLSVQVAPSLSDSSEDTSSESSQDVVDGGRCRVSATSYDPSNCGPSRAMFIFSAADCASAMDYSTYIQLEDGVVDSPPSRGPPVASVKSPSPLRRNKWSSIHRDESPAVSAEVTPQRRLYESRGEDIQEHVVADDCVAVPIIRTVCVKAKGVVQPEVLKTHTSNQVGLQIPRPSTTKFGDNPLRRSKCVPSRSEPQSGCRPLKKKRDVHQIASLPSIPEERFDYWPSRRGDIMRAMNKLRGTPDKSATNTS